VSAPCCATAISPISAAPMSRSWAPKPHTAPAPAISISREAILRLAGRASRQERDRMLVREQGNALDLDGAGPCRHDIGRHADRGLPRLLLFDPEG